MFGAMALTALTLGLAQPPSLGIACPNQPNITPCGRAGIAIWLKRPAQHVKASVGGKTIRLHAGGFGGTGPTYWEGYVHSSPTTLQLPAQWYGTKPTRRIKLTLVVRYSSGAATGATLVQLRPGWG
jgi:hypothetical protein